MNFFFFKKYRDDPFQIIKINSAKKGENMANICSTPLPPVATFKNTLSAKIENTSIHNIIILIKNDSIFDITSYLPFMLGISFQVYLGL